MKFFYFLIFFFLLSCETKTEFIGNIPQYSGTPLTVHEALSSVNLNRIVQVEGTIFTVCKEEGCWLTIKQGKDILKIVFSDPALVIPIHSEGKYFKGEGIITEEVLDNEQVIAYAKQTKTDETAIIGKKRIPIFTVSTIFSKGLIDD